MDGTTIENRIKESIQKNKGRILNVYFTAGYPKLDDTVQVIESLAREGVDLIELGIPYSDPLADGPTIQKSGEQSLKNGMTLETLFSQVKQARVTTDTPIILMGYFNQMLQYGPEKFLSSAADSGVDGFIIPDMPMYVYEEEYYTLFQKYNLSISFLVSPMTSEKRIKKAADLSSAFVYVVSQSSITGKSGEISPQQISYFEKIRNILGDHPSLIGFGIHDKSTYDLACTYADGAIIGSAFIRALNEEGDIPTLVHNFIKKIR